MLACLNGRFFIPQHKKTLGCISSIFILLLIIEEIGEKPLLGNDLVTSSLGSSLEIGEFFAPFWAIGPYICPVEASRAGEQRPSAVGCWAFSSQLEGDVAAMIRGDSGGILGRLGAGRAKP